MIPRELREEILEDYPASVCKWINPIFHEPDCVITLILSCIVLCSSLGHFDGHIELIASIPALIIALIIALLTCITGANREYIYLTINKSTSFVEQTNGWNGYFNKHKFGPKYFGLILFLGYPIYYLIWRKGREQFLNNQAENRIKGKYLEKVPSSKNIVWECLVQKSKFTSLHHDISHKLVATNKLILKLKEMEYTNLGQHPISLQIKEKLVAQEKELTKLAVKASHEILVIDNQLTDMEQQVSTLNTWSTMIEGASLAEANDALIKEANTIFTGYQNQIESRSKSILELEGNTAILAKTAKEIPDVYVSIGGK